jgi:hypothetical protein
MKPMKKLLLASVFLASAGLVSAQVCTPNPLYADSLFGVWPDTTTNFGPGIVGEPYFQSLDLIVPEDAGVVNPSFNGVLLDSVKFVGIDGLPPGLSVACASQTAAPCTYLTGQLGCGVIQGTPTTAGVYPLTLNVTAYANLFGTALPIDQAFTGYQIIVTEGVGITEIMGPGLAGVRNVPNPFSTRTSIEFQMARSSEVNVRVFNLLGEELWSQTLQGRVGANRVPFESADLQDGVYLFKVQSGKDTFTGRMVLNR